MDKLILKAVASSSKISEDAVLVSYFNITKNSNAELKSLAKSYGVKLSKHQITLLIKDKFELVLRSSNNYDLMIVPFELDEKFNSDFFRNHAAGIFSELKKKNYSSINFSLPKYALLKDHFSSEEYLYRSISEGIHFGNYTFNKYKSDKKAEKKFDIQLRSENLSVAARAIQITNNLMSGVYFTRELQNEPAINLTPQLLALKVKNILSKENIEVKVFIDKQIAKMKMGGLLAVGMGSDNPPRFIVAHYKPSTRAKIITIALVGKGVTFDSGGISIKPAQNMGMMKADMSGAAVVAGLLLAAAKAKLQIEIFGIIPAAENMVSGKSMRPGDIVTTSSGKTIEVDNTDAEGRMILADALHYASNLKPDLIIDLATLTGACAVALGEFTAGLFSKNDKLADELLSASKITFDRLWRLPMWDEFHSLNKSDVADVKNVGGRWGGAITAAKFLENWVDKNIPWAHLDIAGPAMPNSINNYSKTYMTGFGVRLLFEFLRTKKD